MTNIGAVKRVLVITGASRGIGLATALKFKSQGYIIINLSRTATPLADSIQITVDLFDKNWPETAASILLDAIQGAEQIVVVHNAAVQTNDTALTLDGDSFREILELNIVAPAILNNLLIKSLPKSSSIIYIGSTLSLKSIANMASYATTKHALVGLMRSTCQDLLGTGVHTACVCPGFTKTEMLMSYGQEALGTLAQRSTLGRLVEPEEIAETIYFCASNPAINGTIIRADSGLIEI
jgi:3-oxoacyl-[acyl-carrier protein] reductase